MKLDEQRVLHILYSDVLVVNAISSGGFPQAGGFVADRIRCNYQPSG